MGNWLDSWAQKVVISVMKSSQSVPEASNLGLILFTIVINDLNDGAECTIKCPDDKKLRGGSDTPGSHDANWRNLNRLQKWEDRNIMA